MSAVDNACLRFQAFHPHHPSPMNSQLTFWAVYQYTTAPPSGSLVTHEDVGCFPRFSPNFMCMFSSRVIQQSFHFSVSPLIIIWTLQHFPATSVSPAGPFIYVALQRSFSTLKSGKGQRVPLLCSLPWGVTAEWHLSWAQGRWWWAEGHSCWSEGRFDKQEGHKGRVTTESWVFLWYSASSNVPLLWLWAWITKWWRKAAGCWYVQVRRLGNTWGLNFSPC